MRKTVVELRDAQLSEGGYRFATPLNFRLEEGEQVAVVGANGSGKTTLVETLLGCRALCGGRLTYDLARDGQAEGSGVRYIAFHETYNRAEDGEYYYQQRWNSCDNEHAPRVGELLDRIEAADPAFRAELYERSTLSPLLAKPVVMLSSGELRKFQIVRMLLTRARVLIVDNPYIGLDAQARSLVEELLEGLVERFGIQLIVVLPDGAEIPRFVTHLCRLDEHGLGPKAPVGPSLRTPASAPSLPPVALPAPEREPLACEEAVRLRGVTVRYDDRTILDALNWTVRNGERWTLAGPNGSGKSTLLSLISADNPQAYAQDITLFGRQRGTGESIWEIKRRIGYVSAEMHRSFLKPIPAVNLVASGYFDSLGLYETPTAEQLASARAWMETFGIGTVADRSFLRLSSGEQRLVLLARAFVKDPDLLILDEPLNGLDRTNKARVRAIVEAFCGRPGKSLIYVSHEEADLPACIDHRLELRRNG
ncbi:MAG: ATP-binding cassette domain-containing protein [Rikenella sp.]|nr:ATP-binding cassette domain-containing protein [Rikenella sp.]